MAYVLVSGFRRLGLQATELAQAQVATIRVQLFKIGAQVRVTARKVWVSMASSYPWQNLYQQVWANLRCSKALAHSFDDPAYCQPTAELGIPVSPLSFPSLGKRSEALESPIPESDSIAVLALAGRSMSAASHDSQNTLFPKISVRFYG